MSLSRESKPSGQSRVAISAWILALCLPIVAAYALIARFAVNIPYIDDYPNFLGFAVRIQQLPSFSEKLYYFLTVQHDEYKFVFMHTIALAELGLTHHVNMTVLSFVGDLFQLALLPVLWRMCFPRDQAQELSLPLFVPIAYMVFTLNYAEGVVWPSSTLFYIPAMFFSFLAIYLLVSMPLGRPQLRFGGACLACCLAGWTAPNSVVLLPIGLVVLLPRRAFGLAAAWCVALLVGIGPYLYRYHVLTDPDHAAGHASLKAYVLFFCSFVGAVVPTKAGSVLAGVTILLVLTLALKTGYHRRNPSVAMATLWVLLCAAVVTYGRAHAGFAYAGTPRYRIFSDLLAVFCFCFAADWVMHSDLAPPRKRLLYQTACGLIFANWLVSDVHNVKFLRAHRQQLLTGLAHYESAPGVESPMWFPEEKTERSFHVQEAEARELTGAAIEAKVYTLPAAQERGRGKL